MSLFLFGVCLALIVSSLCSLAEATLLSLTPSQVADLGERRPRVGALWRGLKSRIERPISVILLINTAAHTVGAAVAGAQFGKIFGEEWLWLFTLIFTFLMLQFTEITPKTIGVQHNKAVAIIIGRPLQVAVLVCRPLLAVVRWLNRPFSKGSGAQPETIEEIVSLAGAARSSREITAQQERIITTASQLHGLRAEEIMIPRQQIAVLDAGTSLNDAIEQARLHAHTRYPICEAGDVDQMRGYINFKELVWLARERPDANLREIVRSLPEIPTDQSGSDLLHRFVREQLRMAVVRDTEGRTAGLLSMEDLVEELVGEVADEFDELPSTVNQVRAGMWRLGGGVSLAVMADVLDRPAPSEQAYTLSDWLATELGRTPRRGDEFEKDGVAYRVRRVRFGKVVEAAVQLIEPEQGA